MITNLSASWAILRAVEARRLVQAQWQGQGVACLLGAIHAGIRDPADCPAELMPGWLAELTPTLFDSLNPQEIYPVAKRYGELIRIWGNLTDHKWSTIKQRYFNYLVNLVSLVETTEHSIKTRTMEIIELDRKIQSSHQAASSTEYAMNMVGIMTFMAKEPHMTKEQANNEVRLAREKLALDMFGFLLDEIA